MINKFLKKNTATKIFLIFIKVVILGAFVFYMNFCFAKSNKCSKDLACYTVIGKTMVHSAATGLSEVLLNKNINEKERIHIIRSFADNIRFYPDKTGYFYVYDYNCINIAHAAQKELEGKNLYNYQDTKQKFVIRELSALAKKGGGFLEFYWKKPGEKEEKRKIGYVEPIPGTNYFIGSGIYSPAKSTAPSEQ